MNLRLENMDVTVQERERDRDPFQSFDENFFERCPNKHIVPYCSLILFSILSLVEMGKDYYK